MGAPWNNQGSMDLFVIHNAQGHFSDISMNYPVNDLSSLCTTLEAGGAAVLAEGNHARCIGSLESSRSGDISFIVYDPLIREPQKLDISQMARLFAEAKKQAINRGEGDNVPVAMAI